MRQVDHTEFVSLVGLGIDVHVWPADHKPPLDPSVIPVLRVEQVTLLRDIIAIIYRDGKCIYILSVGKFLSRASYIIKEQLAQRLYLLVINLTSDCSRGDGRGCLMTSGLSVSIDGGS
jgi:hypothetical protein